MKSLHLLYFGDGPRNYKRLKTIKMSKIKLNVPGLNKVSIKKFSEEGKHKGALKVTQKDGALRFCVESVQVGKIVGGGRLTLDKRTGFVQVPKDLYDLIDGDNLLVEGLDYNEVLEACGFGKVAVYFQKSLTPFYEKQDHVQYMDSKTNEMVDALNKDGEIFYRSPVVRDLGSYQDTWGTIETNEDGKDYFVASDNKASVSDSAVSADSKSEKKKPETIA